MRLTARHSVVWAVGIISVFFVDFDQRVRSSCNSARRI